MAFKNPISRLSDLVADTITGAVIMTKAAGQRWVLSSPSFSNMLQGFTGHADEHLPANLNVAGLPDGQQGNVSLVSPSMWNAAHTVTSGPAILNLIGDGFTSSSRALLRAVDVRIGPASGERLHVTDAQVRMNPTGQVLLEPGSSVEVTGPANISGALAANTLTTIGGAIIGGAMNVNGFLSLIGGGRFGAAPSQTIRGVRFGQVNVSVAASSFGDNSFAHGMGTTPDLVVATAFGVSTYFANVAGVSPTNISVRAVQRDGASGTATIPVMWLAIWT